MRVSPRIQKWLGFSVACGVLGEAVRNFLASQGIGADRVLARGYGESFPVTTNTTEAGRQQNRRVEVVIAHEGQRVVERR